MRFYRPHLFMDPINFPYLNISMKLYRCVLSRTFKLQAKILKNVSFQRNFWTLKLLHQNIWLTRGGSEVVEIDGGERFCIDRVQYKFPHLTSGSVAWVAACWIWVIENFWVRIPIFATKISINYFRTLIEKICIITETY